MVPKQAVQELLEDCVVRVALNLAQPEPVDVLRDEIG